MRRASRPWPLLVLIALAGLFGPPAVASASDTGLRTLVSEQRAEEKRLEAAFETATESARIGESVGTAQIARRVALALRRLANQADRARRSYDRYRGRFAAEAPETNEATVGRTLVLRGLRDGSVALRRYERIARRYAAKARRVRTAEGFERLSVRVDRANAAQARLSERSEKRLKRGRTLIRTAPAPPVPAA
jgi:hypothetical protein